MRPAGYMGDALRLAGLRRERVVAGIGIGVQPAGEPGEMLPWSLALAVWRVAVERRRGPGAAPGPGVEGVDPKPPRTCLAAPWGEDADGRVVGPDHAPGHGVGADRPGDWAQPPGALAHPVGQRLTLDLHPLARQDAREPIERQAGRPGTSRPGHAPAAPARVGRAQWAGRARAPATSPRRPGRRSAAGRAGSPSAWRGSSPTPPSRPRPGRSGGRGRCSR